MKGNIIGFMDKTLQYFEQILQIPSPSRDEGRMIAFLEEFFGNLGYQKRKDEWGNMLFYTDSDGEKILFSAHMDTVPPAVNPHVVKTEDGYVTDGTTALGADDKAAIAVMMRLAEDKPENVVFLFSIAEEIGLFGAGKLTKKFFEDFNIPYSYVLDAENPVGDMITRAPGKTRITLTFHGKSAHAGFRIEEGINAIELASEFVTKLDKGRFEDGSTLNIGSFMAPGTTNVVPEKAELVMEMRAVDTERLLEIERNTTELARKINPEVDIKVEHLYYGYDLLPSSPIIRYSRNKVPNLKITSTMGGSDASHLNNLGLPAVVLSIGYLGAHSHQERIAKAEFIKLSLLVRNLLKN